MLTQEVGETFKTGTRWGVSGGIFRGALGAGGSPVGLQRAPPQGPCAGCIGGDSQPRSSNCPGPPCLLSAS